MQKYRETLAAVGDSGSPLTSHTDPNGAETAMGVPHPENRKGSLAERLSDVMLPVPELSDYDTEDTLDTLAMPPDEDDGLSFPDDIENLAAPFEEPADSSDLLFMASENVLAPENENRIIGVEETQLEDLTMPGGTENDVLEPQFAGSSTSPLRATLDNQENQPREFSNRK